jgi:hypothetical protein
VFVYLCLNNSKNDKRMSKFEIKRRDAAWQYPLEFKKFGMPFKKVYESEIGCIYEQVIGDFRGQYILRYECFIHTDGFYPYTSLWGLTAWTCVTYDLALAKITAAYKRRLDNSASREVLELDEGDEDEDEEDVELED